MRFLAANRARLECVDWAAISNAAAAAWRALCDAREQHADAFAEVESAECTRMPKSLHEADAASCVRAVLCAYNRAVRLTDRSPCHDRLHALAAAQPRGYGASCLVPPPSPCDEVQYASVTISSALRVSFSSSLLFSVHRARSRSTRACAFRPLGSTLTMPTGSGMVNSFVRARRARRCQSLTWRRTACSTLTCSKATLCTCER